ncbi:MAG TPA: PEP/pyruvate-binding domain-containing protein [Candidatus Saccharimonadales bacterium]|nr:PEP/pyruvate-binding domain-containing protein [Candidatus Saccharimonadales bacterium]
MYIKKIEDISMKDISNSGGKGASLGEMTQAGIPVPPGFVITTNAFRKFHNKSFSNNFNSELSFAFDSLNTNLVAVRSSAVAEDSSNASWAGQLESYLNITKENLIDSVKKCWNSINSDRAENYSKQNNIPPTQLIVAVVVQRMVNSEISGVMFTSNPVTNNRNEIMIEAAYGLGELLVQGEITPDNYIFSKQTSKILKATNGSQDEMLVFKNGKNEKVPVAVDMKNKIILNSNQLTKLAELGTKIESHYGFPCDIEWAYENDKFYIIQSRPVTTLY